MRSIAKGPERTSRFDFDQIVDCYDCRHMTPVGEMLARSEKRGVDEVVSHLSGKIRMKGFFITRNQMINYAEV
ncbi:MAG: hypothetical protein JRI22_15065 [Deltaproteobacteria bacterium]|nr:hypothetical protein [Deltaproteobacteria bacterium]